MPIGGEKLQKKTKALKVAFPYTIPILTGYVFLGIAFGILLSSKGYHFIWAIIMSVFIYAGSMQFVTINILLAPFNLLNTILMTLMVNARHLFYGLSMLDKFRHMGQKKWYMIFSLSDETFSLHCSAKAPEDVDSNWFYFFITLLNQFYWVLGSAIGAILGSLVEFNTKGIDFIMTALFVVIFLEQWKSTKNHKPALIGLGSSFLCLFIFGPTHFILPSMLLMIITLTILRKFLDLEEIG